jgi:hypothetical protein
MQFHYTMRVVWDNAHEKQLGCMTTYTDCKNLSSLINIVYYLCYSWPHDVYDLINKAIYDVLLYCCMRINHLLTVLKNPLHLQGRRNWGGGGGAQGSCAPQIFSEIQSALFCDEKCPFCTS